MEEEWMLQMRKKMADYKWPAPELSWNELDQALAAGTTHKTHLLWPRRIAAAAVVLLIAGVGYWGLLRHKTEPTIEMHWAQKLPLQNRSSQGDRNDVTSQTSHEFFDKRSGRAERLSPCDPILAKSNQKLLKSDVPAPKPTTVVTAPIVASDTIDAATVTDLEQPRAVKKEVTPSGHSPSIIYPSDLRQQKHLDNRLTAKVYMSSTMADSRQTESVSIFSSHIKPINVLRDSVQYSRVHHRQPIRFGLSLRYRLDDCWSIESGLSYTRLSSDITTIIEDVTTVIEQRLNYIGLPLNISYELWKSRHFGLYVTAGGTIEKCLDASPWQLSLNGATGAEYKLSNSFSLYAEPGLGYYFKDGSSTPTIYKNHPLNFNLNFGLRFKLK